MLSCGSIVGGIAGGYIGFRLGWAYLFWVSVALSAACFLGVFFLVPETLYDRPAPPVQPSTPSESGEKKEVEANHDEETRAETYRPFTFPRSLTFGPVRGNLVSLFIQPWRTLALPGTWVVMLQYAGLVGGVITISIIGAQLVSMPPYTWGAHTGLINIGGIIGALLGCVYTYVLSDLLLRNRAKHDKHGLSEPEDRLPAVFFPLTLATCGFFIFGFCGQYPGENRWVGLQFGYGMIAFGLMQAPSIGFNYVGLNLASPEK